MEVASPRIVKSLYFVAPLALVTACASSDPQPDAVDTTSSELSGSDPVSSAALGTCDLNVVKGLDEQLVKEIQCLHPGALASLDGIPNITFGNDVFRYLQKPQVDSLKSVIASRGATLHINSALRALPAQYILYRWYLAKRCGITLAASPGKSNHESGLALDVQDSVGWRPFFLAKGWKWQGAADPVHYDGTPPGSIDLRGLSVLAFQKLWNANHPAELIAEDGAYGPTTESKLVKSPLGGFPIGASCADAGPPKMDAGPPAIESGDSGPDDVTPDITPSTGGDAGTETNAADPGASDPESGAGCSASTTRAPSSLISFAAVIAVVFAAYRRKKERGRR